MSGSIPRIVVIEDNPADVSLLRRALDEQGEDFEFITISDGEQALSFIDLECRCELPLPCVILLDLHLPRHDGAAIMRELRRRSETAHVRVAVWTTLASPEERTEALSYGADHFQMKPADLEGFWTLARRLLDMCYGRVSKFTAS